MTFKKPNLEPRFIAVIYIKDDQPDVHRVYIGRDATDTGMDNDVMPSGYHVSMSDFLPRGELDQWIEGMVGILKKDGKKVEFDENLSYKMAMVIEELVEESPIVLP